MAPKEDSETELIISLTLTAGGAAKNAMNIDVLLTETVTTEAASGYNY